MGGVIPGDVLVCCQFLVVGLRSVLVRALTVTPTPCHRLAQLAASAPRTVEELQGLVISGVSEQMKRQYGELVVR